MNSLFIKGRLDKFCNAFRFQYQGCNCCLDPVSRYDKWVFEVSCGDSCARMTFSDLDSLMSAPLFAGKALNEIAGEIIIIDW